MELLQEHKTSIVAAYDAMRVCASAMPPDFGELGLKKVALEQLVNALKVESKRIVTVFNLKKKKEGKADEVAAALAAA